MDSAVNFQERRNRNSQHLLEVVSHDTLYSVDRRKYDRRVVNIGLSSIAWTGVIMVCGLLILADKTGGKLFSGLNVSSTVFAPTLGTVMVLLIELFLVWQNRNILKKVQILTILNATTYVIAATIVYGFGKNYQWLVGGLSGVTQILIGIAYLQKKFRIVFMVLFSVLPVWIGLQVDGIFNVSWPIVMLLPIVMSAAFMVFGVVFFGMGLVHHCRIGRVHIQPIGLMYKGLTMIGLALTFSVAWSRVCFLSTCYAVALPCICFYLLFMGLFVLFFRLEVVLGQAKAEILGIVGGKEAMVSFQRMEGENILYKLSTNWLTVDKNDSRLASQPSFSNEATECVICLSSHAQMVWMPCGHLAVCEGCGKYLMEHSKLGCVICKTDCKEIFHLEGGTGREVRSDCYYCIK